MSVIQFTNAETDFLSYINELVHDSTRVYYRYKKTYPIDQEAIDGIDQYAVILFRACLNLEYEEEFNQPLFRGWKEAGEEYAARQFCEFVNSIIEKKAYEKADRPYYLLPNMVSRKNQILEKIHKLSSEENGKITKIGTQLLTVLNI